LGLGLALPYVALCYLPQLSRWMPKPGAWMQSVQQFMGFLLMGTVIWLLWVLQRQMGSDGLFVLLSLLLCLAVAAWVLGRWGHHHRAIAIGAWLLIFGLGGGAVHEIATMDRGKATTADNAANLPWEKFSPERVRSLRAEGRRIFVDFTAAWCVSCQVNERVVFGSSAVREKIAEKGMVLLKADWTDADPVITEALAAFGRSGVPLYVLYGRGETTPPVQLPEVITPAMVLDALGKLP
jgi:thiol:disulfide interchange protein